MLEIVPAIIPKSFEDLTEKVGLVYGAVPLVQVDVCDGKFVPDKSWPFENDNGEFRKIVAEEQGLPHWEELEYEVHLMTDTPNDEAADWIRAGASKIIVHIEARSDVLQDMISEWGHTVEFGIAVKPSSDISALVPFFEKVGTIQLMGSDNVGHQGEKLDANVYEILKKLRTLAPKHTIAVDIGVNEETAPLLVRSGANKLIVGSAIMDAEVPAEAIKRFQNM